jgi:hypothetical protein
MEDNRENEDMELNKELKRLQNRASKLILNEFYDYISLTDLQHSILRRITNAESHKDINYVMWNSGIMKQTLDDIARKISEAKRQ